jgi:hypothetical protein
VHLAHPKGDLVDDHADTRDRTAAALPGLPELPPYLVTGNRFGSYGFGAGLSGLLLTLVPFGRTLTWVLVLVAIVLGVTGFVRYAQGGATNRAASVVGLTMGWIGLTILLFELSVELNVPPDYYFYGP